MEEQDWTISITSLTEQNKEQEHIDSVTKTVTVCVCVCDGVFCVNRDTGWTVLFSVL